MTDDQKRIAIAEEDGWTDIRERANKARTEHEKEITGACLDYCGVPDYLTSKDAMFDAIGRRFTTPEERLRFVVQFCEITGSILAFANPDPRVLADAYLAAIKNL